MTPARLREIRKSMALTQEGLAVLLGVTRATVLRWELPDAHREHTDPPPFVGLALAAINAGLAPLE